MSGAHRGRDRWLPIVLLVALFLLAPRADAAMSGTSGHAPFALGGAGTFGSTFARGAFKSNGIAGPHFRGRRFGHRRHGDRGFFPYVYSGFPYDDYGYDYGYDERPCPSSDRPRRSQHSGYCDVSGSYPQNCVWKDGP